MSNPFGNKEAQATFSQPFTFAGQFGVMEESDGLYYMRARYYDAKVGRFISEDPIGFGGGDVNLFAYVGNNPVNFSDPEGKKAFFYHFFDGLRAGLATGEGFLGSLKLGWDVMMQDLNQGNKVLHANAVKGQASEEAVEAAKTYADSQWKAGNKAAAIHTWGDITTENGTYYPGTSNLGASIKHLVGDFFQPGNFQNDIMSNINRLSGGCK